MKRHLKWISLCITVILLCCTTTACSVEMKVEGTTTVDTTSNQIVIDGNPQGHTPESLYLMLLMVDDYTITYQTTHTDSRETVKSSCVFEKNGSYLRHTVEGDEWGLTYLDLKEHKYYWLFGDEWEYSDFDRRVDMSRILMHLFQIDCQMVFEDDHYQVSALSSDRFEIKSQVMESHLKKDGLTGSAQMLRNGSEYTFMLSTKGVSTADELIFTVKFEDVDFDMPTSDIYGGGAEFSPLTPSQVLAELRKAKTCYFSIETSGGEPTYQSVSRNDSIVEIRENGSTRFVDLVKGYEYVQDEDEQWSKHTITLSNLWKDLLTKVDNPSYAFFFEDDHYVSGAAYSNGNLKDSTLLELSNAGDLYYVQGYYLHGYMLTADSYLFCVVGYGSMPGQMVQTAINIDFQGYTVELPI